MNIAIFGLTADPVHKGHLEIINRLSEMYDKIVVIPTTIRYYKKNVQMFSFNERFNSVCECVLKLKNHNIIVSDIERSVSENWRFIDSLKVIRSMFGDDNNYFVAMGSDSFQKFETWCDWEEILILSQGLIVFKRPGYEDNFPQNIVYTYIDDINIDISSTQLREEIRSHLSEINDFDIMMDDMSFCEGFEDEIGKIDYNY